MCVLRKLHFVTISGYNYHIVQSNIPIKSNKITFNEHVTNVHACSERGRMIRCSNLTDIKHKHVSRILWLCPLMLSPRGQSDLEAKILASASKLWPRPQGFGLV